MKIAVTGATGHLGGLVVRGLLKKGAAHTIIALARNAQKAQPLADLGAEVRVADYGNPAALEAALAGVDRLLLVSSSEVGQRTAQHKNVIDAAKQAGVKHIVYTSVAKAATSPLILAPEHKATEELIVESGLPHTFLRNNFYTDVFAAHIDTARQSGSIIGAAGNGRVASATRADLAEAAVAVLLGSGHEGKTYELTGDRAWNYAELAATIGEILGQPVSYNDLDGDTYVDILRSFGMDGDTAGFYAAIDGNIAAGALDQVSGDLAALIGRPPTPLKQGLEDASRA